MNLKLSITLFTMTLIMASCVPESKTKAKTKESAVAKSPVPKSSLEKTGVQVSDKSYVDPSLKGVVDTSFVPTLGQKTNSVPKKVIIIEPNKKTTPVSANPESVAKKVAKPKEKIVVNTPSAVEKIIKPKEKVVGNIPPAIEKIVKPKEEAKIPEFSLMPVDLSKVSLDYNFLVDDICLARRLADNKRKIYYTVDYFANEKELETDESKYTESLIAVGFRKDFKVNLESLKQIIRADTCVKAITNRVTLKVVKAKKNATNQMVDHFKKLFVSDAFKLISKDLDPSKKIKIAVIDSGYDLNSSSLKSINPKSSGYDYFDHDEKPHDEIGHGSEVSSIIASRKNNRLGVKSLMSDYVEIIPIKLFNSKSRVLTSDMFHDAIKRSINYGADIINLSFEAIIDTELKKDLSISREKAQTLECPVAMGYSLKKAIEQDTMIVMAAGHGTSYEKYQSGAKAGRLKYFKVNSQGSILKGTNGQAILCKPGESPCSPKSVPGPIYPSSDNGTTFYGNNSAPGCWARYLKGAINVASLNNNDKLSSFSNWGAGGVEIATIGEGLNTISLNDQKRVQKGTSYSSPIVASALAMIMNFHKTMAQRSATPEQWHMSPWYLEDILLNGSDSVDHLKNGLAQNGNNLKIHENKIYKTKSVPYFSKKAVLNGRLLNFKSLADYLVKLKGMSYEQRRDQKTENLELGRGIDPNLGDELVALQVYTEGFAVNNKDRIQLQAIAVYKNGATKVVTDNVTWSSNTKNIDVNNNGIAFPRLGYQGAGIITASLNKIKGQAEVNAIKGNIVTGSMSKVPSSLKIELGPFSCHKFSLRLIGITSSLERLDYTNVASWVSPDGQIMNNALHRTDKVKAGQTVTVKAYLYGKSVELKFKAPTCEFAEASHNYNNAVMGTEGVHPGTNSGYMEGLTATFKANKGAGKVTHSVRCRIKGSPSYSKSFCSENTGIVENLTINENKEVSSTHIMAWGDKPSSVTLVTKLIVPDEGALKEIRILSEHFVNKFNYFSPATTQILGVFENGIERLLGPDEVDVYLKDEKGEDIVTANARYNKNSRGWFILNALNDIVSRDISLYVKSKNNDVESSLLLSTMQFEERDLSTLKKHDMKAKIVAGLDLVGGARLFRTRVVQNKKAMPLCLRTENLHKTFSSGKGDEEDPYIVCNLSQLKNTEGVKNLYIRLGNNIEMKNYYPRAPFGGYRLDGNGYELRNLLFIQKDLYSKPIIDFYTVKNLGLRSFKLSLKSGTIFGSTNQIHDSYIVDSTLDNAGTGPSVKGYFLDSFHIVNVTISGKFGAATGMLRGAWLNSYINATLKGSALESSHFIGGIGPNTETRDLELFKMTRRYGHTEKYALVPHINNLYVKLKTINNKNTFISSMNGGVVANSKFEVNISSPSNNVGGIVGSSETYKLSYTTNAPVIYNNEIKGTIRGRDYVGGIVGVAGSLIIEKTKFEGIVKGQKGVGGLVGKAVMGYLMLRDNDVFDANINSTSEYKSDTIGFINSSLNRGVLSGEKKNFYMPIRLIDNNSNGTFINKNRDELFDAFNLLLEE